MDEANGPPWECRRNFKQLFIAGVGRKPMKLNPLSRNLPYDRITGAKVDDGTIALLSKTETGSPWIHIATKKDGMPRIVARENGAADQVGACTLRHHSVTSDDNTGGPLRKFEKDTGIL